MRYIIYVVLFVFLTGFSVSNIGNKTIVANEQLDLLTIASTIEGEDVSITEWSLHAREKMDHLNSLDQVKEYSEGLEKKFSEWSWEMNLNGKQWEAKGINVHDSGLIESIQVIATLTKNHPQTYTIYEAKNQQLNKKSKQFLQNQLPLQFSDIFRGKPAIFSCIKGEFSDKMNKTLPDTVNYLLTQFKAEEIESLEEDNFISTSAYSEILSETITTKNKEMNLQLGIRTKGLGAKTTLVVGTPIITIEY